MKYIVLLLVLIGFSGMMQISYAEEILIYLENNMRKIYYTGENIISVSADPKTASIIFETGANTTLDVQAPKIYKVGPGLFTLRNGEEVDVVKNTDDCFYYARIETQKPEKIEIVFAAWPEYKELVENCETFTPSPLKQYKAGIPFSEIKCNVNLQITQRYDGTPACIKDGTVFELIKRGWTSDIIRLVQSRDIFLDPKDATSSYMDKIIPTIDDFKNMLSEPYDIDTIFSKFGKPHDDIGSGIHIYVYELNDSTEIWIGYVDDIWYVKHVDTNGNVLEDLFLKK